MEKIKSMNDMQENDSAELSIAIGLLQLTPNHDLLFILFLILIFLLI
jgi:hypothetical protein